MGGGGLQNGLKGGGTVHTRRAHPFNNPPLKQLSPRPSLGIAEPCPRMQGGTSPFGRRGIRTPLDASTRETCAWETVVLPPALPSRYHNYFLKLEKKINKAFNVQSIYGLNTTLDPRPRGRFDSPFGRNTGLSLLAYLDSGLCHPKGETRRLLRLRGGLLKRMPLPIRECHLYTLTPRELEAEMSTKLLVGRQDCLH